MREKQIFNRVSDTVATPQVVLLCLGVRERTTKSGFGIGRFIKGRVPPTQ